MEIPEKGSRMRMNGLIALVIVLSLSAVARADVIVSSGYYDLSPAASGGGTFRRLTPGSAARTPPFPGRQLIWPTPSRPIRIFQRCFFKTLEPLT